VLRALLEERSDQHFGAFTADRIAFIRSDLQPAGPVYTTLEESRL
jgi:2'-5' RNA ligase